MDGSCTDCLAGAPARGERRSVRTASRRRLDVQLTVATSSVESTSAGARWPAAGTPPSRRGFAQSRRNTLPVVTHHDLNRGVVDHHRVATSWKTSWRQVARSACCMPVDRALWASRTKVLPLAFEEGEEGSGSMIGIRARSVGGFDGDASPQGRLHLVLRPPSTLLNMHLHDDFQGHGHSDALASGCDPTRTITVGSSIKNQTTLEFSAVYCHARERSLLRSLALLLGRRLASLRTGASGP